LASLGHPCKFQRVSRLGSVTARHFSTGRQPNFAALNRGRRLYSAGRPSRWALAYISSCTTSCRILWNVADLLYSFRYLVVDLLCSLLYTAKVAVWHNVPEGSTLIFGDTRVPSKHIESSLCAENKFNRFEGTPTCDGRTDGRTFDDSIHLYRSMHTRSICVER